MNIRQINQKFRSKKPARLLRQSEFKLVAKEGKKCVGKYLCIVYRPSNLFKFGVSASKRFGIATQRNRFKRLVKEAFRKIYPTLPPIEINVIPRQNAKVAKCQEIEKELTNLIHEFK